MNHVSARGLIPPPDELDVDTDLLQPGRGLLDLNLETAVGQEERETVVE